MKKKGLGRGLDQLLPVKEDSFSGIVRELPISDIDPNESQPRQTFEQDSLEQLAQSIEQVGVLQPILVVPIGRRYQIVAGERRYRAARMVGLKSIPSIVKEVSASDQMEIALIENLQREDLNPVEQALAIQELIKQYSYTQEQVANKLGKSRPVITNLLRILSLPDEIISLVRKGELSAGHARVLAGIVSEKKQKELATLTVLKSLSVRQLEQLAAKASKDTLSASRQKSSLPLELLEMQEMLHRTFGLKTTLSGSLNKGRITLQYYSQDDLERIYELIQKLN